MADAAAPVIAIDGPSGSGKSTLAKRVAARLGLRYLDTGAMYRALTWLALQTGVDVHDAGALAELAARATIEVDTSPRRPATRADGVDVTRAIRSRPVTNAVSAVSAVPAVRERMVARQREIVGAGGIVVEGRDIGTAVVPGASVKIFLTASTDARAVRRHRQFANAGESPAVDVTRQEIERRDATDSSRAASPLRRAADAYDIDSTALSVGEVLHRVLVRCAELGIVPPPSSGPASSHDADHRKANSPSHASTSGRE